MVFKIYIMIKIKRLIFTIKSSILFEKHSKYTFEIGNHWTKIHVCWVIEKIFVVSVKNVNILCFRLIINRVKIFNYAKCKHAIIRLITTKQIKLRFDRNFVTI